MTTTPHLAIALVEQSQAQKEITVNQAFSRLDAFLNNGAKSRTLATPPGSPATGDLYIVAASPTGDWSGQAGKLAFFDSIWRFITPQEGMTLWINNEDILLTYDGTNWQISTTLNVRPVATAISAAGTNQATATALTNSFNEITTIASAQGVALPTPFAGKIIIIANQGANTLNVYPASGHSINNLATNTAQTLATDTRRIYFATTSSKWYSL